MEGEWLLNGLLVVGENGFAWIAKVAPIYQLLEFITLSDSTAYIRKWVRWHDVVNVFYGDKGAVKVRAFQRHEDGTIRRKLNDSPKTQDMRFIVLRNKDEPIDEWKKREEIFGEVFAEIYSKYRVESPPFKSDSIY